MNTEQIDFVGSEKSQNAGMDKWIVLSEFDNDGVINLDCPECGNGADCPTHGYARIIASFGLTLILGAGAVPKDDFLPEEIQCPACGASFETKDDKRSVSRKLAD